VYRRGKPDEKKEEKREEREKIYESKKDKDKDNAIFKKFEDVLSINLK
jgi:hypothetical protein